MRSLLAMPLAFWRLALQNSMKRGKGLAVQQRSGRPAVTDDKLAE